MKRTLIVTALLFAGAAQANEPQISPSVYPESYPAAQEIRTPAVKTREQVKAELAAALMRTGVQNPETYPGPSEFISLRIG